jgi:hypothetical protein
MAHWAGACHWHHGTDAGYKYQQPRPADTLGTIAGKGSICVELFHSESYSNPGYILVNIPFRPGQYNSGQTFQYQDYLHRGDRT